MDIVLLLMVKNMCFDANFKDVIEFIFYSSFGGFRKIWFFGGSWKHNIIKFWRELLSELQDMDVLL